MMRMHRKGRWVVFVAFGLVLTFSLVLTFGHAVAQQDQRGQTSYLKVDITEPFASIMARMSAAKPAIQKRQTDLLNERYDLADRPAQGATMSRGKPLQEGVRVKLPAGTTWDRLAALTPAQ